MNETNSDPDLLNDLAHEFAQRYRRGECPALTEYTDRYPELAEQIRALFPALVLMEEFGSVAGHPPASPAQSVQDRRKIPSQLGEYRILREVGRGGMGIVYEAVQESLGRHVALKVLPFHGLVSATHLERFEREAKAVARLHHTNIVPVFGSGESHGVHYYAMQFIQGQGLDAVLHEVRRLRRGAPANGLPLTVSLAQGLLTSPLNAPEGARDNSAGPVAGIPPESTPGGTSRESQRSDLTGPSEAQYWRGVARLEMQVAEALAYAHRQGIVHRDIKPSNLLLDTQGVVWVTDFGLVKEEGGDNLTQTGDLVGTVRYMAPERFDGQGDARGDVYGLGATLYELLVLRPVFEDTNRARLVERVLHEEPVRPRKLDPKIPRDLETIVLKALAKEPARRYQTAGELAEDLRRFLADRPVKARRTRALERLWRWTRRNPAVASLLGLVAGLLLAVAIVSILAAVRMDAVLVQTQAAEREARLREAEALISQAHSMRFSRRVGQRFEALAALKKAVVIGRELDLPPEWHDPLRNEAIACLALSDWRPLREWEGLPSGTHHWDCDDGQRLYARKDLLGHISVRQIDGDEEIAQFDGFQGDAWLQFSPNGRFLAMEGLGQQRTWDLANASRVPIVEVKSGTSGESFHPDGRHMALTRMDGSILVYDLTSPQKPPRLLAKVSDTPVRDSTFDPGGNWLALTSSKARAVHVLDAQSGKARSAPWLPKAPINSLAWHPAGKVLAAASGHPDSRIYLWDMTRGQEAAVLEGCRGGGLRIAFTPDGEFVVSQGWEGKLRFWNWRTGEQVLSHPADSNLRFSPEGRLLIAEGNRLRLAEFAAGREYRSLVQQSSPGKDVEYWRGALHPDGRLLAVTMSDGARLWDLETGDEVARIGPNEVRGGIAFAADSLVTNGPPGLLLWPIRHDRQAGTEWQIGPPRPLGGVPVSEVSCSKDGQIIAQAEYNNGAIVLHRVRLERPIRLRPQEDVRKVSMSPDGRFVATGTFGGGGGLKIWETEHGQVVKELPLGLNADAAFSPDGRWLAVRGNEGGRLLTVGTWEEGPAIQCDVAMGFSPDGNLLAVETGHGVIRLLDPATGREKARLEDSHQDRAGWLGFTPDGTRLVAVSEDGRAIHVWDLKRIRAGLARLGLDWHGPAYPERADPAPRSLTVRVVGVDLLPQLQEAIALNDRAWYLLTGPAEQRNPKQAIELIQRAIERDSENRNFLNTLGVAQYRNGQYTAAVATLEKSFAASKGQFDGFDLFFLAMCHAKLGESSKAKDCFDRGVKWSAAQRNLSPQQAEELKVFLAEAEVLLLKLK